MASSLYTDVDLGVWLERFGKGALSTALVDLLVTIAYDWSELLGSPCASLTDRFPGLGDHGDLNTWQFLAFLPRECDIPPPIFSMWVCVKIGGPPIGGFPLPIFQKRNRAVQVSVENAIIIQRRAESRYVPNLAF